MHATLQTARRDGDRRQVRPADARLRRPGRIRLRVAGLALAALLLGACGGRNDGELPVLYDAPSFALTDQAGDTLTASDLAGQAWVVQPFFTGCRNVCPLTTARMASLRDSLAAEGLLGQGARLVSITVDPARDSTRVLSRWAEDHGGNPPGEWAFLRGSPPDSVRSLIQGGFHLSAMMPHDSLRDPAAEDYQVIHASQVLLVDGRGRIRATYEILRPADFRQLVRDTRRLAEEAKP